MSNTEDFFFLWRGGGVDGKGRVLCYSYSVGALFSVLLELDRLQRLKGQRGQCNAMYLLLVKIL